MDGRFAPRLRSEVEVVRDDEGRPVELRDPVLDRKIHLGAVTASIVERLDGTAWDEVAVALAREHRRERGEVDRLLRKLMLLGVIAGAGEPIVAEMRAARGAGAAMRHAVLEGSRFECQGSGACCQNHRLGPLTDEDVARLDRLDLDGAFPHLGGGPYHEERERDGERARYLRAVDHRCLFLTDDRRCALHARFGPEAKPGLCRLFPLEELPTIQGLRFYDKGACDCFAVSARRGEPLVAQLATLLPVLPARRPIYHPIVRLGDAVLVDYGHHLRFTGAAIAAVRTRPGGAPAALAAIGAAAVGFRDALAACPLAPGEPDATVASVLAELPRARVVSPLAEARDGAELFTVVLVDLIEALETIDEGRGLGPRLVGDALALFRLGYRLAARAADPAYPLSAVEERMLDVGGVADPDVDDVLALSLTQQLFGYRSLVADRPLPALARMALLLLAAIWGARRTAVEQGTARIEAGALSSGHALAARALETSATSVVLVQHEELLPSILAAVPLLAGVQER